MNPLTLAQEIIDGRRITREDDLSFFLTCDLDELCEGADRIREACIGDKVDLCSIINGRSGRCPEDCKYCAQSAHHHTSCEVYNFLPEEKILEACKMNESEGVDRFSIVTAGKALTGKEFDQAIHAYETMHRECKIDLCASMGFISAEQLHRLHKAGVTSYHHNIETSRRNFPNICTTHTYDMKIETLKKVKAEGMCACSGGIIGMGETWEDRLDMAISLAELGIDSIPINALMRSQEHLWNIYRNFLSRISCVQSPSSAISTRRQTSVSLPDAHFSPTTEKLLSKPELPLPSPETC